jgi:hypothetical protein
VLGRLNAQPARRDGGHAAEGEHRPPLADTARYDSLRGDGADNATEEADHA